MTPKEKAEALYYTFNRFVTDTYSPKYNAKQCALISVDEILYAIKVPPIENKGHALYESQIDYWQEVKTEIEKL